MSDIRRSAVPTQGPGEAGGYLIGPRLAGAIKLLVDQNEKGVSSTQTVRLESRFEETLRPPPKMFRICTFTGSWAIGSDKTITFKSDTARTAVAKNLFWPVPEGPTRDCAIAREGTAWYLVTPQLYSANAATAATLTTAALEFSTLPVVALATASTVTFSVTASTCGTAQSTP